APRHRRPRPPPGDPGREPAPHAPRLPLPGLVGGRSVAPRSERAGGLKRRAPAGHRSAMAARRYDFVAIGGGNAGLTAAAAVAAAGRRVALVDRGPVGGLCSLAGCNPKKVLVRTSEALDEI